MEKSKTLVFLILWAALIFAQSIPSRATGPVPVFRSLKHLPPVFSPRQTFDPIPHRKIAPDERAYRKNDFWESTISREGRINPATKGFEHLMTQMRYDRDYKGYPDDLKALGLNVDASYWDLIKRIEERPELLRGPEGKGARRLLRERFYLERRGFLKKDQSLVLRYNWEFSTAESEGSLGYYPHESIRKSFREGVFAGSYVLLSRMGYFRVKDRFLKWRTNHDAGRRGDSNLSLSGFQDENAPIKRVFNFLDMVLQKFLYTAYVVADIYPKMAVFSMSRLDLRAPTIWRNTFFIESDPTKSLLDVEGVRSVMRMFDGTAERFHLWRNKGREIDQQRFSIGRNRTQAEVQRIEGEEFGSAELPFETNTGLKAPEKIKIELGRYAKAEDTKLENTALWSEAASELASRYCPMSKDGTTLYVPDNFAVYLEIKHTEQLEYFLGLYKHYGFKDATHLKTVEGSTILYATGLEFLSRHYKGPLDLNIEPLKEGLWTRDFERSMLKYQYY